MEAMIPVNRRYWGCPAKICIETAKIPNMIHLGRGDRRTPSKAMKIKGAQTIEARFGRCPGYKWRKKEPPNMKVIPAITQAKDPKPRLQPQR